MSVSLDIHLNTDLNVMIDTCSLMMTRVKSLSVMQMMWSVLLTSVLVPLVCSYEDAPTLIIIPSAMDRGGNQQSFMSQSSSSPDRFLIIDDGESKNKQDTIIVFSEPPASSSADETRKSHHKYFTPPQLMASETTNSYVFPPSMKRPLFQAPPITYNHRLPVKTNDYDDEDETPTVPVKPLKEKPEVKAPPCNLNVIKNLLMMHMMFMMKMNAKQINRQIDEKMSTKKCDHCKSEIAYDKNLFAYEMIDPSLSTPKFIFNNGKLTPTLSSSSGNKFHHVPTADEISFAPFTEDDVTMPLVPTVSPLLHMLMRKMNNDTNTAGTIDSSETLSQKDLMSLFKMKSSVSSADTDDSRLTRKVTWPAFHLKSAPANATDSSDITVSTDSDPKDSEEKKARLLKVPSSWNDSDQNTGERGEGVDEKESSSSETARQVQFF